MVATARDHSAAVVTVALVVAGAGELYSDEASTAETDGVPIDNRSPRQLRPSDLVVAISQDLYPRRRSRPCC